MPEVGQGFAIDLEIESLRFKSSALAGFARGVAAVSTQENPDMHAIGPGLEPVKKASDAVPRSDLEGVLRVATFTFDDPLLIFLREFIEGRDDAEPTRAGAALEVFFAFVVGIALEGANKPLRDGERFVRYGLIYIDSDDTSEAAALGAGTHGVVERKEAGDRGLQLCAGIGRGPSPGKGGLLTGIRIYDSDDSFAEIESPFESL